MQFSPKGGNEMAQVSSDDAKRAKSAGKARCQAYVLLSTEGTIYLLSQKIKVLESVAAENIARDIHAAGGGVR